jgi:prepilin-type N-terminal cleavage/methylation domain-containing protein
VRTVARAGFTLVEVLVTLLIVGGMMLAITQILEATRISRDTIHNIQETQLAGPAIMDLVERDLRGLFVYNREQESLLRVVDRVEAGLEADSLDFVTATDSLIPTELVTGWARSDYNEVGYRLRPNPADNDFLEIYRREGFGVDDQPFEGGAFTFLHERVKHFSVQVFTEDGPDAEPLSGWSGSGDQVGLPLRLEVELVLELSPRILREQLRIAPVDKRTVTYRRIVSLPQSLRDTLEVAPRPFVPRIVPPNQLSPQGQAPATPSPGGR